VLAEFAQSFARKKKLYHPHRCPSTEGVCANEENADSRVVAARILDHQPSILNAVAML
jgi:hypothetical protein